MIRFSAALVVVAVGVLIAGVAASSLLLVYLAIGVSAVALLILAAGVLLKRDELFTSDTGSAAAGAGTLATGTGSGQQAVSGGHAVGAARVPAVAGAGTRGGVSSQQGAFAARGTAAPWDTPGGAPSVPGWAPGAWPPPEPGSPAAPAAPPSRSETTEAAEMTETDPGTSPAAPAASQDRPSLFTPSSRRRAPMAPPTRADPVIPWADSLPTRIETGKDKSPEPAERVPSWLADVDDDTLVIPAAKAATSARHPEPSPAADAEITRVERIIPAEDTRVEQVDGGEPAEAATDEDVDDTAPALDAGLADDPDDGDPAEDAEPAVAAAEPEVTAAGPAAAADVAAESEADSRPVTVVPGVPRYHDEDCILVRFLDDTDVEQMPAAAAEKAGCTPCRACHPEDD